MNTQYTKQHTITIKKAELFFDIDKFSLDFSKVSGGDNVRRADRIAFDTSTTNGERTAVRLCDKRMADIRQLLEKFIDTTTSTETNDQLASGDYTLAICITTEAEDNIFSPITDLIHDYIVNGALADWYVETGVGVNAEALNAKCTTDLAGIKQLIYFRTKP